MRFGVYLLEEGIKRSEQLGKSEQVCVLYDRSGFNYRNFDLELFTTSKNLVTMLQDNYAERLGALYVLGAGWFYWMIFNIVKVFLTQRTKEKIILINSNDELLHYFDVDQLESEYLSEESRMQLRQEKEKAESGEIDSGCPRQGRDFKYFLGGSLGSFDATAKNVMRPQIYFDF